MIERHPRIEEVEEGFEIEPGVRVLHTPGHSPGSICLLVETDQGKCILTSDVLLFANQALSRTHPVVFWNQEQAIRSLDRVIEEADVIYPGHDQPFRLVNGEIEYLEQMKLNITGVAPDEPGLEFTTVAPQLLRDAGHRRADAGVFGSIVTLACINLSFASCKYVNR